MRHLRCRIIGHRWTPTAPPPRYMDYLPDVVKCRRCRQYQFASGDGLSADRFGTSGHIRLRPANRPAGLNTCQSKSSSAQQTHRGRTSLYRLNRLNHRPRRIFDRCSIRWNRMARTIVYVVVKSESSGPTAEVDPHAATTRCSVRSTRRLRIHRGTSQLHSWRSTP